MISGGGSNCAEDAERPVSPPNTDDGRGPLDRACVEGRIHDYHTTCSCPVHCEHAKLMHNLMNPWTLWQETGDTEGHAATAAAATASRSFHRLLIGPPNAQRLQQEAAVCFEAAFARHLRSGPNDQAKQCRAAKLQLQLDPFSAASLHSGDLTAPLLCILHVQSCHRLKPWSRYLSFKIVRRGENAVDNAIQQTKL